MEMSDEIIKRVNDLTYDQQKKVLKDLQALQESEKLRCQSRLINRDIDSLVGDSVRVIPFDTRDLSASGVYIGTTRNLEPDKGARVVFMFPNHTIPFELKVELIRTEPSVIAIKFEDQSPYLNRILDNVYCATIILSG